MDKTAESTDPTANKISAELSAYLWQTASNSLSAPEKSFLPASSSTFSSGSSTNTLVSSVLASANQKHSEAIAKNWTFKRHDGTIIVVRDIFAKIVESITKFQGAVDFLVSLDVSGHAALPWMGVKFLLGIASADSQKWGSVLAGLEFVTREIAYYGIFEVIYLRRRFSATKQLSDALVQAYTKILQFLAGARRYYEQNTLKRFLGTAFMLDEDLSGIVKDIKSERDDIERLRGMIDGQYQKEMGDSISNLTEDQKVNQTKLVGLLNDLAAPMEMMSLQLTDIKDEVAQMHTEMRNKSKAEELPKIFDHLQPGKVANYESKLADVTPGTATWIFKNEAFVDWYQEKTSLLFISGGPGTGKSHLSTKIIDYVRNTPRTPYRPNRVGYYYFKDSDKDTRSALTALCSMVYQIAAEDEIYRIHASQICDHSPNFTMASLQTVWNDFLAAEHASSSEIPLFLVFDGVDEAAREEFSEFLTMLSTSFGSSVIQILFVGRPEMRSPIEEKLGRVPVSTVEISSQVNIDDIRKFCQDRYDKCIKVPKSLKALRHKVIETLTRKADGMFLWVDLIYKEELQDILSPSSLSNAIANLPDGGLDDLYDRIFSRIERENGTTKYSVFKEIFAWTAFFKEPLSLFYLNELLHLSTDNWFSDAEPLLEKTCASLFILVKTGETLVAERNKLDNVLIDGAGGQPEALIADASTGNNDDEADLDEEVDFDDADFDEEKELAAMAEADERLRNRHRETFVNLRHASLGDYLKKHVQQPTNILFAAKDAEINVIVQMLQIICKGADAPQELWLYLMTNCFEQLGTIDSQTVPAEDVTIIIGCLHKIFTSKNLGKHIAKFHHRSDGYPLLGTTDKSPFFFGYNGETTNPNIIVIRKWISRANELGTTAIDSEILEWIVQISAKPLKMLLPLVNTCVDEWYANQADGWELYWKSRFIWQLILSTDLLPPLTQENERKIINAAIPKLGQTFKPSIPEIEEIVTRSSPQIEVDEDADIGDRIILFIGNLPAKSETLEMHLTIAKCVSYINPGGPLANIEYDKVMQLALQQNSKETLKTVYLQRVLDLVDLEGNYAEPQALEAVQKYLELDPKNPKVLASLGLVCFGDNNFEGAIENYRKALEIDKLDAEIGILLLRALFRLKNFEGLLSLFDQYGSATVGNWIRQSHHDLAHRWIIHAALVTNNVEKVIACYKEQIHKSQPSEEALQAAKNEGPEKTAQKTLELRRREKAISSTFQLYLGWILLDSGRSKDAFQVWKTAFFRDSEFFSMGLLVNSSYETEIIPDFFARFSQLIFERSFDPDPQIASEMLAHLEHLSRREQTFRDLEKHTSTSTLRNINLLLARCYMKLGRMDEARQMLNVQFQRCIDILEDDIDWNDTLGYVFLAPLLFLNKQYENATIACSLNRFLFNGFSCGSKQETGVILSEEGDDAQSETPSADSDDVDFWAIDCSSGFFCEFERQKIPSTETAFTCTTCANVSFCEKCFDSLRNETQKRKTYTCSPKHEFIKSPAEGLEKIKGGKIVFNGTTTSITDWVAGVKKEWKKGDCFKS